MIKKVLLSHIILILILLMPLQVFARHLEHADLRAESDARQQRAQSLRLLDEVRKSVKTRRTHLENEARKEGDDYLNSHRIHYRKMRGQVNSQRLALLSKIEGWSQLGKKGVLALTTDEINDALSEATAIGNFYGLNTRELTKLYEIGKNVIKRSLFELPENTHPDDDYSYERLKQNVQNSTVDALKPGLVKGIETLFASEFNNAQKREIEIAEFLAKKQEYRVLLFKRVTLAYIRALLMSGEERPACDIEALAQKAATQTINGKKYLLLNCPDPAMDYLRRYVNAIRTLQSAESDTFTAHSQMVIAEEQLVVDMASALPVISDGIDWFNLGYGIYAQEDLTGHCVTYLSHATNFVAAVLPVVSGPMLSRFLARNPNGYTAAFINNMGELMSALNYKNARTTAVYGTSGMLDMASDLSARSDMLANFAKRWNLDPADFKRISDDWIKWLNNVELNENELAKKLAIEAKERATARAKRSAGKIMENTTGDARADMKALAKLKSEATEFFEMAVKKSDDTMAKNLMAIQPEYLKAVENSNLVPEHVEALKGYLRDVAAGKYPDMNAEEMIMMYRSVNPDATALIKAGFHTKGMNIKGKSADWGVHRAFIPVDQNFSKLGNPDNYAGVAKITDFQNQVDDFYTKLGSQANDYRIALKIDDKEVKIVKDLATGQEMSVFYKNGTYSDEAGNAIAKSKLNLKNERPMMVIAVPDKNGIPRAVTADYDFLAFGFQSPLETPKFSEATGYVTDTQNRVIKDSNEAIRKATGYTGDVSHHGPEAQYPFSPGALQQDERVFSIDLSAPNGVVEIPRCDMECMIKWCDTNSSCKKFGYPHTPVCNPKNPFPPCIPVDVNRLYKDYVHNRRLHGYNLFPNKKWGWGDYNLMGGWTLTNFVDIPVSVKAAYLSLNALDSAVKNKIESAKKSGYEYFLKGTLEASLKCPAGKKASDFIEEGQ